LSIALSLGIVCGRDGVGKWGGEERGGLVQARQGLALEVLLSVLRHRFEKGERKLKGGTSNKDRPAIRGVSDGAGVGDGEKGGEGAGGGDGGVVEWWRRGDCGGGGGLKG